MSFGGGKYEDHAGRRFLNGLQQRIEGCGRQHMNFVDNENFVTIARRGDGNAPDYCFAHILDAGV
jgi:hypothetical protein